MNLKNFSAVAAIFLFTASSAFSQALPQHHRYTNPAGDEFPILAWYSVVPASNCTTERYKELADAGFNLSFSHTYTLRDAELCLKNAKGTGVKLIIGCNELLNDTKNAVTKLNKYKTLAGYFFRDEPNTEQFKELGDWVRKVRENDDNHLLYLNLFPDGPGPAGLRAKDWTDYATRFVDEVGLGLLSYDYYPVQQINSDTLSLKDTYYKNLEDAMNVSKKAGQPLWTFALTTAHWAYPVATRQSVRLQVFSGLAYGAQGIEYFTYWTPGGTNPDFHAAPIDSTERRTEVYDILADVNKEIQNLAWVFLGSEVLDVSHTGANPPAGTHCAETFPQEIGNVEASGQGVLVSRFRNGKKNFAMIVNRDINRRQQVTVHPKENVMRVMPSGKTVNAGLYTDSLWLDPGDYLLYCWE